MHALEKNIRLMHGLLRSKNVPNNKSTKKKHIIVNRDFNGSMLVRTRAVCNLTNTPIPIYLQRNA